MQFILSSGGIGDALLGVAESFRLGKPMLIMAANRFNRETIEQFIEPFGIPYLVLEGSFVDKESMRPAFQAFKNHPGCLSTCHLPDNMNYVDWSVRAKYEPRVPTVLPVQELFGKIDPLDYPGDYYGLNPRPLIGIAPASSNLPAGIGTPLGEFFKDRNLSTAETVALAQRFLPTHDVALLGSHEHESLVDRVDHPNCFWASAEYLIDHRGNRTASTVRKLYALLNSCQHIYSVDTWFKTYSCYANVPTIVIRTRYSPVPPPDRPIHPTAAKIKGCYPDMQLDLSENIFLNRNLWNLKVETIENLLAGA